MSNIENNSFYKKYLWYLATPYRAHPEGLVSAYEDAKDMTNFLMKKGWHIYCPIVYSHYLDKEETTDEYWLDEVDGPMLMRCSGLIIVKLDGWRDSKGIWYERGYMRGEDKVIVETEFMQEPVLPEAYPNNW